MSADWKLVKDDKSHWHYEKVERGCCEFWDQERICVDCPEIEDGEPSPVWHASMCCPFCRGPGEERKSDELCETG